MYYGDEDHPVTDFTWYVPEKFYRLTKVEVYFSDFFRSIMPGFKVTYEPDPIHTTNWPTLTQEFGNTGTGYFPWQTPSYDITEEIT